MSAFKLDCVLFDLDGTLVDTAPDLIACLNRTLVDFEFPRVVEAEVRPLISLGALPMIKYAVPTVGDELQLQLLETMLDCYQANIAAHSRFFDGIEEVLANIEAQGLKWGVVTNKRKRFTEPLLDALQLTTRAACIVSGDTTANSKPHPEPMLFACQQAGVDAKNCVYIGDAKHDIAAGKNASMRTLAALYGYLNAGDKPHEWGADAMIEHPRQLLDWIEDATLCH